MSKPTIDIKDLDDLLCKYQVENLEDLENRLKKVFDLEAKLAEHNEYFKSFSCEDFNEFQDFISTFMLTPHEEQTLIREIKQQLAEKEEKLNSDWYKICERCGNPYGASQFSSKDENGKDIYVCSNCNLIETVYKPQVKDLENRIAIAEYERHEEWKTGKEWKWEWQKANQKLEQANQDKISFAVEWLKLTKKLLEKEYRYDVEESDYAVVYEDDVDKIFDNQIKQLKEGVKNENN